MGCHQDLIYKYKVKAGHKFHSNLVFYFHNTLIFYEGIFKFQKSNNKGPLLKVHDLEFKKKFIWVTNPGSAILV